MATHRHWSATGAAEEIVEAKRETVTAAAPEQLTHVYIGRYEYDGDSTTKVFSTREACVAWRDGLCGDHDNFEIYHRKINS